MMVSLDSTTCLLEPLPSWLIDLPLWAMLALVGVPLKSDAWCQVAFAGLGFISLQQRVKHSGCQVVDMRR